MKNLVTLLFCRTSVFYRYSAIESRFYTWQVYENNWISIRKLYVCVFSSRKRKTIKLSSHREHWTRSGNRKNHAHFLRPLKSKGNYIIVKWNKTISNRLKYVLMSRFFYIRPDKTGNYLKNKGDANNLIFHLPIQ